MRTLVADDDPVLRRLVTGLLTSWGHEVESAGDGDEAWQALGVEDPPPIAILDWIMPGPTGVEICRRLRESTSGALVYVLLLTSRGNTDDIVTALASGADDYVTKPFEPAELRARLQVGERVIGLQRKLAERVTALEHALAHVTRLQACTARRSATTRTTGSRSSSTSATTRAPRSATASAPSAWSFTSVPSSTGFAGLRRPDLTPSGVRSRNDRQVRNCPCRHRIDPGHHLERAAAITVSVPAWLGPSLASRER